MVLNMSVGQHVRNSSTIAGNPIIAALVLQLVALIFWVKDDMLGRPRRPLHSVKCPEPNSFAWICAVYPMIILDEYLTDLHERIVRITEQIEVARANYPTLSLRIRRYTRNPSGPNHRLCKELARLKTEAETASLPGLYHAAWSKAYNWCLDQQKSDKYFTDVRTEAAKMSYDELQKSKDTMAVAINTAAVQLYFDFYLDYVAKKHPEFLKSHQDIPPPAVVAVVASKPRQEPTQSTSWKNSGKKVATVSNNDDDNDGFQKVGVKKPKNKRR